MIEPDRYPARGDKDGDAIARDQCPGVINFYTPTTHHFHGERTKGSPPGERVDHLLKVVRSHNLILAESQLIANTPRSFAIAGLDYFICYLPENA
jgi:hypothetical protein